MFHFLLFFCWLIICSCSLVFYSYFLFLILVIYKGLRWRGKEKKKNKEPLSRLFVLTWLFDRLSYFHYPDCSCDNYWYGCYPSNWISQWSLSIGGNPEIVLCYLKLYAPFNSGAISVLQFILIYKDFGWWEGEEKQSWNIYVAGKKKLVK